MMKFAYYNEFDPQKAAWLREVIKCGLIAPGDVDERSIKDVEASELVGYTQCHFFAGIGIWSYALRLAGWGDERPVWTGSCPCPSFSAAGKGEGFDDARHLWPDWYRLICERRPSVVFGEQVAAAIGHGWLDLVCAEMEAKEYAVAAAVLGAHSAGAPHIRQRLYFCADTERKIEWRGRLHGPREGRSEDASGPPNQPQRHSDPGQRPDTADSRRPAEGQHGSGLPLLPARFEQCGGAGIGPDADGRLPGDGDLQRSGQLGLLAQDCGAGGSSQPLHPERRPVDEHGSDGRDGEDSGRPEAHGEEVGAGPHSEPSGRSDFGDVRPWRGPGWLDPLTARSLAETGATRGFWADCDWWYGRDGKYRPAGPGVQPLAHGVAARVVKLRGYGDGIVSETAAHFIAAAMEVLR